MKIPSKQMRNAPKGPVPFHVRRGELEKTGNRLSQHWVCSNRQLSNSAQNDHESPTDDDIDYYNLYYISAQRSQ